MSLGISFQHCSRLCFRAPASWVYPGLFLSFPPSSVCHCPRLVFSLLISLRPLPTLRFFFPSPPQVCLALPSTHPSPSMSVGKLRGAGWAPKESRKHPERSTITPAYPVSMIAGKYVFIPYFHGAQAPSGQSPLLPAVCKPFFQRLITWPNLGRFPGCSKQYTPASEASSCQISRLFPLSWGNASISETKSSPRHNTETEVSLKLSEVFGTVWQYLRQTLGMENINLKL